jgi:hypothetical protein
MTTRARHIAAAAAACLLLSACAAPDPHPADLLGALRGRVRSISVVASPFGVPPPLATALPPNWQAALRQAIPPCRGPYAPECTIALTVDLREVALDRREPTTNAAIQADYQLADLRNGAVFARRTLSTRDSRSSTDQVYGEDPGRNALAGATERNIAGFLASPAAP